MSDYDWRKFENICLMCGTSPITHWIGCGCLINMKTYVFGYCTDHFRYRTDHATSPAEFAEKKKMICSDHEDRQSHYFEEQIIVEKA